MVIYFFPLLPCTLAIIRQPYEGEVNSTKLIDHGQIAIFLWSSMFMACLSVR